MKPVGIFMRICIDLLKKEKRKQIKYQLLPNAYAFSLW
jgi:hypothetical protein